MWAVDDLKIRINGKETITGCRSLRQLQSRHCPGADDPVVILNGFQTSGDLSLRDGDEVAFIEKGKMPDKDEFEAVMSARHTPHIYDRIKRSRVAVAGLGGLGSNIALALARTGVGCLHLVDDDLVEPSNLNRQQYGIRHLGLPKTEALRMEIEEVNPYISVVIDTVRVARENVRQLFIRDAIVCEAFDDPDAKALLVNSILEHFPDKKIVAGSGLAGFETSNSIATKRCLKNLYLCGDGRTDARPGRGLMAPRVLICAGHQANMVLRLILGIEDV